MDDEELQTLFDTVITHLRTQGEPALDVHESCVYRTEDRDSGVVLKCAVGCLIEDKDYSENLEGEAVTDPVVIDAVAESLSIDPEFVPVDLLEDLQDCHDHTKPENWESEFIRIAANYNLKVPE